MFYFHPYLGKWSNVSTNIYFFQTGWFNHQLVTAVFSRNDGIPGMTLSIWSTHDQLCVSFWLPMLWSWPKLPMRQKAGWNPEEIMGCTGRYTCVYRCKMRGNWFLKICVSSGNDAIRHQFDFILLFFEIGLKPPSRKKDGEIATISVKVGSTGDDLKQCTDMPYKPKGLDMGTYRDDSCPIDDLGYRWIQQSMLDEIWLVYNMYYTHNLWIWCMLLSLSKWFAFKSILLLLFWVITPK